MLKPDSPVGQFLCRVYDLLMLSILFLVFSLPVVTLGIASIALYETVYAVREGRGGILFRDYFDAFRRSIRKGFGLLAVYAAAVLLSGGISGSLILLKADVRLAFLLPAAVFGGLVCWVEALSGRYEQKLTVTVRNAWLIGLRNLPLTLLLALLRFGPVALIWLLPESFLRWYLFALMFFLPAGSAFGIAALVLRTLRKQYPDQSG